MAEKNVYADALGEYLWQTKEFGFKDSEVLVIHTDTTGEVTKKDLDIARAAARDIDKPDNKFQGNRQRDDAPGRLGCADVSVVVGLRPFTAKPEIYTEQVIGRGLSFDDRHWSGSHTDSGGVGNSANCWIPYAKQLEADGVGVGVSASDPPRPVTIYPVEERRKYDIAIPITKPRLTHNIRKLGTLDYRTFEAIYETHDLDEVFRYNIRIRSSRPQRPRFTRRT